MNRSLSLAVVGALGLFSASSFAFVPPPPKNPTTTITLVRSGATTLTVSGVHVTGGWKLPQTAGQASGGMVTSNLAVSMSLGKIDSYTALLDGMTASTVGAPSFSIVRPVAPAGQVSGKLEGPSIALHRTATTSDDWKTWMTTHGPVKGLTLRALSGASDVRVYTFAQCGASSYDYVANADGTYDDTLVVSCSATTATEAGGLLAPAFADLIGARALTGITVASPGRTAITLTQGAVVGYSLANGTETYALSGR